MARTNTMTVRTDDTTDGSTIYMALDLGHHRWQIGVLLPGDRDARLFDVPARDGAALWQLIARQRSKSGDTRARVVSCFEAGRDGFWLHRWFCQRGIQNHVLDPASIDTPQRGRRIKTDRVDTIALLRILLRLRRGETDMTRAVTVPGRDLEDVRRNTRERERLIRERTGHINRIRALLVTQGIAGVNPRRRDWLERLDQIPGGDGAPLGPALRNELRREDQRLQLVQQQIDAVEAEQRAALEHQNHLARGARQLMRFKGIGLIFAATLMHEAFWRDFHNRRQVGASFGLAPWPWQSGTIRRDQPISKAGNRRARRVAIECAWMWLRHQPASSLATWWRQRFADGGSRSRRIGIVALARKLMVALWRYLKLGLVPDGACIA